MLIIWIAALSLLGLPDLLKKLCFRKPPLPLQRVITEPQRRDSQRFSRKQPNHVGALGNLGVVYSWTQRSARAMETYQRALRLSPGDVALCSEGKKRAPILRGS